MFGSIQQDMKSVVIKFCPAHALPDIIAGKVVVYTKANHQSATDIFSLHLQESTVVHDQLLKSQYKPGAVNESTSL